MTGVIATYATPIPRNTKPAEGIVNAGVNAGRWLRIIKVRNVCVMCV